MLSELWGIYGAKFHTNATSAVTLGAILQEGVGVQTMVEREPTSGEPYPRWASIHSQKFQSSLATKAIAAALGLTGVGGLAITADGSHPGLVLYAQKQADGSTRASGSNHRSFTIAKGLIVPTRLVCEHQQDAVLEYLVLPTYDGSNEPVVAAGSVALPTTPTDLERFSLGPITFGGVSFTGFTRLEIDFGINAQTIGAESAVWDPFARIQELLPSIALSGFHVTWWGSSFVPTAGLACTHANSTIFLRARANKSTFVADGTASHVKFTTNGLATVQGGFSAQGNSLGEASIRIDSLYDGSTVPLAGSAGHAIS
jgi:hypothetical protein